MNIELRQSLIYLVILSSTTYEQFLTKKQSTDFACVFDTTFANEPLFAINDTAADIAKPTLLRLLPNNSHFIATDFSGEIRGKTIVNLAPFSVPFSTLIWPPKTELTML